MGRVLGVRRQDNMLRKKDVSLARERASAARDEHNQDEAGSENLKETVHTEAHIVNTAAIPRSDHRGTVRPMAKCAFMVMSG